jgi:nitrogen regulatory protein PII 2
MKEILAVIRMNKINATKAALVEAGYSALTGCKVMGRGSRPVDYEVVKAATEDAQPMPEVLESLSSTPRLIAKRMITLVVPDESVPGVVEVLIQVNRSGQTGNAGDGKIFVLPMSDAVRIRTGDTGDKAVSEMLAS